jgi:hypothetical protein
MFLPPPHTESVKIRKLEAEQRTKEASPRPPPYALLGFLEALLQNCSVSDKKVFFTISRKENLCKLLL